MGAGLVLEGGRWMTQEEMIEAMGDGDMEAFHLFYQDTARPVYSFILSLTRNPEEAEDVMQDTYLTVWTKAGSLCPPGQASGLGIHHSQESLLYALQGAEDEGGRGSGGPG